MGRFSPSVLPTATRSPFAAALLGGVDSYLDERDKLKQQKIQQQAASDTHTLAQQKYVQGGGLYDMPPGADGTDITVHDTTGNFGPVGPPAAAPRETFSPPSSSELARGLRGESAPLTAGQGGDASPAITSGDLRPAPAIDWGAALRGESGASGSGLPDFTPSASAGTTPTAPAIAPPIPARSGALHPGGFDPVTHTFGGTPQRAAAEEAAAAAVANSPATMTHLGPTGRYVRIDASHVQDRLGSDDAMNREAQREFSAALLGQRIGAQQTIQTEKGDQAQTRLTQQEQAAKDAAARAANGDYVTLQALSPTHPLARAPFNPDLASTYQREVAATHAELAANGKRAMTPYQQGMLDMYSQRIAAQKTAADAKAAKPTPDQVKSETVSALAGPAADALIAYHGGDGGAGQKTAAVASHIPLVGRYLEGKIDPAYQKARNDAETLATQYLEIMPKSRFQPSTLTEIMKQIEPDVSDAPAAKQAKIARIKVLKAAIAKRAALRPDAQAASLDDIPQPPGTEEPPE